MLKLDSKYPEYLTPTRAHSPQYGDGARLFMDEHDLITHHIGCGYQGNDQKEDGEHHPLKPDGAQKVSVHTSPIDDSEFLIWDHPYCSRTQELPSPGALFQITHSPGILRPGELRDIPFTQTMEIPSALGKGRQEVGQPVVVEVSCYGVGHSLCILYIVDSNLHPTYIVAAVEEPLNEAKIGNRESIVEFMKPRMKQTVHTGL